MGVVDRIEDRVEDCWTRQGIRDRDRDWEIGHKTVVRAEDREGHSTREGQRTVAKD